MSISLFRPCLYLDIGGTFVTMGRQLFICVLWILCAESNGVSRPPGVFIQPSHDVFYKAGETVELPCVSKGLPSPRYTWKRNGIDFNPNGNDDRMVQLSNVGTIVINRPEDRDEGIFQCFAQNDYGVSASINIKLREAKLQEFHIEEDTYSRVQLGDRLTLRCIPPAGIPPPEIIWIIISRFWGFMPINLDHRVTMDHESRLRFTHVVASDSQGGEAYACMAMNTVLRRNTQGPRHFIRTVGDTEVQHMVEYMWSSPTDNIGLRGDRFKIKCIFSGNPAPDVQWTRLDGQPLPDNARISSYGQELSFNSLQFADQGDYVCFGTNSITPRAINRTLSVTVVSRPYWIEEPHDVELGVGSTGRFRCVADGIPKPDVKWYINSVPLGDVQDPRIDERFKRVRDNEVIFENLTLEDTMVIQCNVTNVHGYIWGDVYLNVLSEAATVVGR